MWKGQAVAPIELQFDFSVKTVISGFVSCVLCCPPTFETKPSANAIDPVNHPLESNGFYVTKSINNHLRSNADGFSCLIH